MANNYAPHKTYVKAVMLHAALHRYEDMSEFEDAMGGTFKEFLSNFPIIELKDDERVAGGVVFKV